MKLNSVSLASQLLVPLGLVYAVLGMEPSFKPCSYAFCLPTERHHQPKVLGIFFPFFFGRGGGRGQDVGYVA